jgi:hypothetical protein
MEPAKPLHFWLFSAVFPHFDDFAAQYLVIPQSLPDF